MALPILLAVVVGTIIVTTYLETPYLNFTVRFALHKWDESKQPPLYSGRRLPGVEEYIV